jgi:hypothetical protein
MHRESMSLQEYVQGFECPKCSALDSDSLIKLE